MSYSIKQLGTQEPAAITAAITQCLTTATLLGWSPLTDAQSFGVTGTLTVLLALFYVRPLTLSKGALQAVHDDTLQAIDLGKQLAPKLAAPRKRSSSPAKR